MFKKIYIGFGVFLFWFVSCSTPQHLQFNIVDADVVQVKTFFPNTTRLDLEEGYNLYINNCSNCHRLHHPKEYQIKQWDFILNRMFKKIKSLNEIEKRNINLFVLSKAKH